MNIKKISLCQNENWDYSKLPRGLSCDYKPNYCFIYPFSYNIALDCERIVYKLMEYNVSSDICWHLVVVFINNQRFQMSKLIDFIAFGQKNMRFVNIAKNANEFNLMSLKEKREYLLNSICDAILLVTDNKHNDTIRRIINEVLELADNTECVYLQKRTKKYDAMVKFKSSLNGYDVILSVKNNFTGVEKKQIIFKNGSYADLEYRISKIIFKGKQCVVKPKDDEYSTDEPIVVNLF